MLADTSFWEIEARGARARRRRAVLATLAALALVAAGGGALAYEQHGARLSGGMGEYGAGRPTGTEMHSIVMLDTHGGTVELRSATPVGVEGGVDADVQLVRLRGGHPGFFDGPLGDGYEVLSLRGASVTTHRTRDDYPLWLDLRVVTTQPGVARVAGIDVRYRTGVLRERTAHLDAPLCLVVAATEPAPRPTACF